MLLASIEANKQIVYLVKHKMTKCILIQKAILKRIVTYENEEMYCEARHLKNKYVIV